MGIITRSKTKNDNGAEPRFGDHSNSVPEDQGQSPWGTAPTTVLHSPRHDDMPILNGMVQPADNHGSISAESDSESETASYFRAPFTQVPAQCSGDKEAEAECPPPVRVMTPPSSPVQRRSVNFSSVLIDPIQPPQSLVQSGGRTPTSLSSMSNSSNVLIHPMDPPQPYVHDENQTPDSAACGQSVSVMRSHRRANTSIRSGGQPRSARFTPPSSTRANSSDRSITRGEGREIRAGLSNLTEMVLNVSAQLENMKKGETARAPKRAKHSMQDGSADLYHWGRQLTAPFLKQPVVNQASHTPYAAYTPYQLPMDPVASRPRVSAHQRLGTTSDQLSPMQGNLEAGAVHDGEASSVSWSMPWMQSTALNFNGTRDPRSNVTVSDSGMTKKVILAQQTRIKEYLGEAENGFIDEWLRSLDHSADTFNWPEDYKRYTIEEYLGPKVKEYLRQFSVADLLTYEDVKRVLTERYGSQKTAETARNNFPHMRQEKNESSEEFLYRLSREYRRGSRTIPHCARQDGVERFHAGACRGEPSHEPAKGVFEAVLCGKAAKCERVESLCAKTGELSEAEEHEIWRDQWKRPELYNEERCLRSEGAYACRSAGTEPASQPTGLH